MVQHVEVFKTKAYGRMLVLDGVIQVRLHLAREVSWRV